MKRIARIPALLLAPWGTSCATIWPPEPGPDMAKALQALHSPAMDAAIRAAIAST